MFENKKPINKIAHFKVNDYDLQILRTEAAELAIEKLGIDNLTDLFFDGRLGNCLVKIIDYNHPLSLPDLSDIQEELKKRTEEDRNIKIICLGQREDTKTEIAEWNQKSPINKFEIVDLNNERFMLHEKCTAEIVLEKNKLSIKNFCKPNYYKKIN